MWSFQAWSEELGLACSTSEPSLYRASSFVSTPIYSTASTYILEPSLLALLSQHHCVQYRQQDADASNSNNNNRDRCRERGWTTGQVRSAPTHPQQPWTRRQQIKAGWSWSWSCCWSRYICCRSTAHLPCTHAIAIATAPRAWAAPILSVCRFSFLLL